MSHSQTQPPVLVAVWKEALDLPVIDEQVMRRADAWRESGFTVHVIAALEGDSFARCTKVVNRDGPSLRISRARFLLNLPFWLRRAMLDVEKSQGGPGVIVCRGALTTFGALLARAGIRRNWCVIHDSRGWTAAESNSYHRGRALRRVKGLIESLIERTALRHADYNTFVSEVLLGVGLSRSARPERCVLIPPYVEPAPVTVNHPSPQLPCPPAQVLYVGNSAMPHQNSEDIGAFLVGLACHLPHVSFGWLDVPHPNIPTSPAPNLWRVSASRTQVQEYLRHADVGLLIRALTSTNAAATPTKAVQYLTAGCKIVTSPFPPSIANLCELTGAGLVVDGLDPDIWAAAVSKMLTRAASETPDFRFHDSAVRQWTMLLRRAAQDLQA